MQAPSRDFVCDFAGAINGVINGIFQHHHTAVLPEIVQLLRAEKKRRWHWRCRCLETAEIDEKLIPRPAWTARRLSRTLISKFSGPISLAQNVPVFHRFGSVNQYDTPFSVRSQPTNMQALFLITKTSTYNRNGVCPC
jgi:hypothetical protein